MNFKDFTTIISRLLTATAITGLTVSYGSLPVKAQNNICPNQESIEIERKQLEEVVTNAEEMKAKAPKLSNQANAQRIIAILDEEITNNQCQSQE